MQSRGNKGGIESVGRALGPEQTSRGLLIRTLVPTCPPAVSSQEKVRRYLCPSD